MSVALITGGSRGLGRSAALALAQNKINIIFTYQSNIEAANSLLEELKQYEIQAKAIQLDVRETNTFAEFIETLSSCLKSFNFKKIDYVLNNAGTGLHKPFDQITEDEFDNLYQIHLKAPFFLTQKLLPLIKDGGHILNISSGLTRFSFPGYSAYAMMKGGIEVMSRYLAKELGHRQISVNTLAPGAIATDFNGGAVRDIPEVNKMVSQATAKGRPGEAEDIGNAIALLLNPASQWITGQRIEASGGMCL